MTRSSSAAGTPMRPARARRSPTGCCAGTSKRHADRMFAGSEPAVRAAWRARWRRPRPSDGAVARAAEAMRRRPSIRCWSSAARRSSLLPRRRAWPRRCSDWACRSICRAWRAGSWGATPACRCATRAARRCAKPTACCSPACLAISGSTTASTCGAAATLVAANRSGRDARLNRKPDDRGDRRRRPLHRRAGRPRRRRGAKRASGSQRSPRATPSARREIDAQAGLAGEHVNPVAFLRALDRAAGDNAIFVADGGDFVATASYILRPRGPLAWLDPGAFGTLGVGAGFALGAAVVQPGAEVWLIWGDGACGYGLAEFDTFVRHGIPVIAVVGNDAGWTQIAREQVKMLGDDVGTVLARTAYHEVVKGFGAEGWKFAAMRTSSRGWPRHGGSRPPASRCSSTSGSTRPSSAKGRSRCRRVRRRGRYGRCREREIRHSPPLETS